MDQSTNVNPYVSGASNSGAEHTTGNIKQKVSQSAREAGSIVKEKTAAVADKAKEVSRDIAHDLSDESRHFAETRKDELAQRIRGGGEAVRRAAEKLRGDNDPHIAGYADAVADRMVRVGDYVQNRDLHGMRRDLEQAARRRPELVFGGMFLAGLAIARFLKASSREDFDSGYEARERMSWSEQAEEDQSAGMAVAPATTTTPAGPVSAPVY